MINDVVKIVEPKTPRWLLSNETCPKCECITEIQILFEDGHNYTKAERCKKCDWKKEF